MAQPFRQWSWVAVATVVVAACWYAVSFLPATGYRIDLDVYRIGGQVWLDGGNLYGDLPGIFLPFTYPPIAAILFTPLAALPLGAASVIVTCLSIIALAGCAVLAVTLLRLPIWPWVPLAIAVSMALEPVRSTLSFGQINILLMAAVMLGCLVLERRPGLGGALLGLAAAVKLTPAVFGLYLVYRRDWRRLAGMIGAFVGLNAVAAALRPDLSWEFWSNTLTDTERIGGLAYAANQSLNGILLRSGVGEGRVLWLALCVAVVGVLSVAALRLLRDEEYVAALTLVAVMSLACSPVSWSHHWVWCVPMLLVAAAAGPTGRLLAGVGVVVFVVAPHWRVPYGDDRELQWLWWQHLAGEAYMLYACCFAIWILCCRGNRTPWRVGKRPPTAARDAGPDGASGGRSVFRGRAVAPRPVRD